MVIRVQIEFSSIYFSHIPMTLNKIKLTLKNNTINRQHHNTRPFTASIPPSLLACHQLLGHLPQSLAGGQIPRLLVDQSRHRAVSVVRTGNDIRRQGGIHGGAGT